MIGKEVVHPIKQQEVIKESFFSGKKSSGKWPQLFATILSSFGYFACGSVNGWSGAVLFQLDDDFEMGPTETSFIVSLIGIGCFIGSLLSGRLMDIVGRKRLLQVMSPVLVIGWLLIALAPNILLLCLGRFITGLSTGFFFTTSQVYVSEISESSLRGTLGSFSALFMTMGIFASYIVGSLLPWRYASYCCTLPGIILFFGMFAVPESSYWYLLKGRKTEAIQSLSYFRGPSDSVREELQEMEDKMRIVGDNIGYMELLNPRTRLPVAISLFVHTTQQFCGANILIMYTSTVLEAASITVDIRYGVMAIGLAQLIGTIISTIFMDRIGRKILLIVSVSLVGVFMLLLGTYFLTSSYNMQWPGWLPVLISVLIIFCYCLGTRGVPWIMSSELFNTAVRSRANSIAVFYNRILNVIIVQAFPFLEAAIGSTYVFYFFGAASFILSILVFILVPETKGKSLEQIQEYFEARVKKTQEKDIPKI